MNSQSAEPVRYLTLSELYNINFTVTEGETFIRDIHLLESAVKRPAIALFGQPQFPTLIDKAAALLQSLAYHHLFADGNKRTAAIAVAFFLERNGFQLQWDEAAAYDFIIEVAQGQLSVDEIARRLQGYVFPAQP